MCRLYHVHPIILFVVHVVYLGKVSRCIMYVPFISIYIYICVISTCRPTNHVHPSVISVVLSAAN